MSTRYTVDEENVPVALNSVFKCLRLILDVLYQVYGTFVALEGSCRLIVFPEKGVLDIRECRLTNSKVRGT